VSGIDGVPKGGVPEDALNARGVLANSEASGPVSFFGSFFFFLDCAASLGPAAAAAAALASISSTWRSYSGETPQSQPLPRSGVLFSSLTNALPDDRLWRTEPCTHAQ
jgi:hypothetical protein